jgi:hypothetical protein
MIELSIKDCYITKEGKSAPINLQVDMTEPKPVRFVNEIGRVYGEFSRDQWAVIVGAIQAAFDNYSDMLMDLPEED